MSQSIDMKARTAAAGACALLAEGDDEAAQSLLRIYLSETMHSVGPMVAMQRLVAAAFGVAVMAVDGPDRFREVAISIAASSGECV